MCFYYSITKKPIDKLAKGKIIEDSQLSLFDEQYIVSGFDHPKMPIITDENPSEIQHFQWGFMPSIVQNRNAFLSKYSTLNANAERIESSKLFAESLSQRRCLVLCSGFFEWKKVKKEKVPYYISLKEDELFVFAGVWNTTIDSNREIVNSFAILTIEANELMADIHNTKKRMPLILSPESANRWLNPNLNKQEILDLIKPISADEMKAHTIKKFVPSDLKNCNTKEIFAYYHYPVIEDILPQLGF